MDVEKYKNKIILAPMVRVGTLPMRLLSLKYGADLVYSEELVDYCLIKCKRVFNGILNSVDLIDDKEKLVFRTCALEKDQVIMQIGTSDPERALIAARLIEKDISGIDVNMGCPKGFSIKGGMGAALLENPNKIKDILETLVKNLTIPVTCKIRVLPSLEKTISLVRIIESCGVSAIAVHGRTKDERPKDANRNNFIREIAKSVNIPVISNGGSIEINSYEDIFSFKEDTNSDSVMIARSAKKNASIFRKEGLLDKYTVANDYLEIVKKWGDNVNNLKYVLGCIGVEKFVNQLRTMEEFRNLESIHPIKKQKLNEECNIFIAN